MRAIIAVAILAAGLVYGMSLMVGAGFQAIDEAIEQRKAIEQRIAEAGRSRSGQRPGEPISTGQGPRLLISPQGPDQASASTQTTIDLPQVGTDYDTIIRHFGLPEHTELGGPFAWYTYRRFVLCVRTKDGVIVAVSQRPKPIK
ncbi:hypothetical protein LBMAG53_29870 [Planctomycetota bacterium]|nr:hypothetical protein LBMAG53_29870 [Planctomycetota bacterium]